MIQVRFFFGVRMPTHFTYEEPNKAELFQGDVLQRGEALDPILQEYFPYYFQHRNYRYFMVLTQSCDLARRDGRPCGTPYISLSAVRPVKDVLLLEAAKTQDLDLLDTNIINATSRQKLGLFLESLMDNNKPGFFYLHTDAQVGITEPSCAFLHLAISFRATHFGVLLEAKIAQLKEPFQAKLGWLLGTMYSRVGTTEWNTEKPTEKVGSVAGKILKQTVIHYDDNQLKAAMDGLRGEPQAPKKTMEELNKYINNKKIVSKLTQFKEQVVGTMGGLKLVDPIRDKIKSALSKDDVVREAITTISGSGIEMTPADKASLILKVILDRIDELATDDSLPGREKYVANLVADMMADNALKSFIK